jgi:hypothetical protein
MQVADAGASIWSYPEDGSPMTKVPGWVLVLALAGGCYRSALVSPEVLRAVRAPLGDSVALETLDERKVALGPRSLLRARLLTGETTPWFTAAFLLISPEGLVRDPAARMSEVHKAWVHGLTPDQLAQLRALAPPGGVLVQESLPPALVTAPSPEAFRAWVGAFARQAPPPDRSSVLWSFELGPRRVVGFADHVAPMYVGLPTDGLATLAAESTIAPGIRWREVQAIEVESLAPTRTALAVPATLVLAGLMLRGPAAGDAYPAGVVWKASPDRRLFSAASGRRSTFRVVVSGAALAGRAGDAQAGLGLGARFLDFLELLYVARRAHRPAGSPGARDVTSHGLCFGFHLDGDGDARLALQVALEVSGAAGGQRSILLRWGPRFGLPGRSFVSLLPLSLQNAWTTEAPGRPAFQRTAMLHGVELGVTF